MNDVDKALERAILQGVQGTPEPVVEILGPNNTIEQVPVSVGIFHLQKQIIFNLQQAILRLEGLHQHARMKEHNASGGRKTCPVCIAIDNQPKEESEEARDASVVAGNVGASAGVQGITEEEQETSTT